MRQSDTARGERCASLSGSSKGTNSEKMKHIRKEGGEFIGMRDDGMFRMPVKIFTTLCHREVPESEIDDKNPDCECCIDVKWWDDYDNLSPEEREKNVTTKC